MKKLMCLIISSLLLLAVYPPSSTASIQGGESLPVTAGPSGAPTTATKPARRELAQQTGIVDPAPGRVDGRFKPGSHVKLFLPYLPYLAITHSINSTLVRPANNQKGWEYDLAESHIQRGDRIFEFKLKKGIRFQDGSPFNADAVLLNMKHFKERPFTYTKLWRVFERAEKIDEYAVRFVLTEPNGVFLYDLTNLPFYTKPYLDKFGWNGKSTLANLAEPGPYALGPYILVEGYLEGDRSSPKVVLKANPVYWRKGVPKVETITIYTALEIEEATSHVLHQDGLLDITPIPFALEAETVLSEFAKLVVSPSTSNYAVHFNLINGNKAMRNNRIRYAINQSIDQEMMLNLSMLGEGILSPTMVSPNFYKVDQAIAALDDFFRDEKARFEGKNKIEVLRKIVTDFQVANGLDPQKPLELRMLTQESFLFLVRDIKYFLSQINIDLAVDVVGHEKTVFRQLFGTHKNENEVPWDILIWANFDWFRHPWAAFFVYRPNAAWSSLPADPVLSRLCDRLLEVDQDSPDYVPLISSFIKYVYQNNYMLFLPSPNSAFAVNKEVVFHPRTSSFMPLWELEVTDLHWSVRGRKKYPENQKKPYQVIRKNFEQWK
jgi:ABC-type transport system substrate-binding protein